MARLCPWVGLRLTESTIQSLGGFWSDMMLGCCLGHRNHVIINIFVFSEKQILILISAQAYEINLYTNKFTEIYFLHKLLLLNLV